MDLETACKKILNVALPFSQYSSAPIAYVCVSKGKSCPFSEDQLSECFAKLKWDTELSSAELSFNKIESENVSFALQVTEVIEFESENCDAPHHKIQFSDGFIL